MIRKETERLSSIHVGASKRINDFLTAHNSTPLNSGISLADLLKRSELCYSDIHEIDPDNADIPYDVAEQVEINLKYEGYIKRQNAQVEQFKKLESKQIPVDIDYSDISSLRLEATQKLSKIRPESVGRAARISGVSPADISVLLVYLEQKKNADRTDN